GEIAQILIGEAQEGRLSFGAEGDGGRGEDDFVFEFAFPRGHITIELVVEFGWVEGGGTAAQRGEDDVTGARATGAGGPREGNGIERGVTGFEHFERRLFERPAAPERSPLFLLDVFDTVALEALDGPAGGFAEAR